MKLALAPAVGVALGLALGACDWKPDREPLDLRSAFTPEPPPSPTSTPLPEGEWSLASTRIEEEPLVLPAVTTTAGVAIATTAATLTTTTSASLAGCGTILPAKVVLAGERGWYQLTGARLAPAEGRFDGAQLSLEARKVRTQRPTVDCVTATTEHWTLLRDAPDANALTGRLHVETLPLEGAACPLPCEDRLDVSLLFTP